MRNQFLLCFYVLLWLKQLAGRNSHHIIEATFKAFARALRQATEYDARRRGTVPRYVFNVCTLFCNDVFALSDVLKFPAAIS